MARCIEQKNVLGESVVYQHDPRHVEVPVKDLGLEHGNSVQLQQYMV